MLTIDSDSAKSEGPTSGPKMSNKDTVPHTPPSVGLGVVGAASSDGPSVPNLKEDLASILAVFCFVLYGVYN